MPRTAGQAALAPWLILLLASLGVVGIITWDVWPHLSSPRQVGKGPGAGPPPVARPGSGERRHVRLFFPQEAGDTLKEQEREMRRLPSVAEEVRAVLRELAQGGPGVRAPLPPGIEVRQVFVDAFGIAYLDFTRGIQAVVTGPGRETELALSALVTTLTTSFTEIKRVQVLVEGQEVMAVAGDMDLRRPISPHFPGVAGPTVISHPQD